MCVFCEIINGNIPSTKVYEDDMMVAFKDLNPVAPVHFLCVPKEHIKSANALNEENAKYVSHIFEKFPRLQSRRELSHTELLITAVLMPVKLLCTCIFM